MGNLKFLLLTVKVMGMESLFLTIYRYFLQNTGQVLPPIQSDELESYASLS